MKSKHRSYYGRRMDERVSENTTEELINRFQQQMMRGSDIDYTDRGRSRSRTRSAARSRTQSRNTGSFFDRTVTWREHKMKKNMKKVNKRIETELSQCTFRPKINRKKKVIGGLMFLTQEEMEVPRHEKLFEKSFAPNKDALMKKQRKMIAQKEVEGCTFRPQLHRPRRKYQKTKPRYLDHYQGVHRQKRRNTKAKNWVRDMTFKPKINRTSKYNRGNRKDVFERLAKRRSKTRPKTRKSIASLNQHTFSPRTNHQKHRNRRTSLPVPPRGGKPLKKVDFNGFLRRYEQDIQGRVQNRQKVLKEVTYSHEPLINENSKKIIDEDFFSRLQKGIQKKKRNLIEKRIESQAKFPYRPNMNSKKSKSEHEDRCQSMRRRSSTQSARKGKVVSNALYELSVEYLMRKETKKKKLKAWEKNRELKECTFEPKINERPARSGLGLDLSMKNYIQKLRALSDRRDKQMKKMKKQKQKEKLIGCTFKPRVHKAPKYIRRIAASTRNAKKGKDIFPMRPGWQ